VNREPAGKSRPLRRDIWRGRHQPMLDAKNAAGRAGGVNLPKNDRHRHMRLYAPAMAYWPLAVISGRRPALRWP